MKILFIVLRPIEINSSTSIWNNAMINGLIENGHDIDVLSVEADLKHQNYDNSLTGNGCKRIRLKNSSIQKMANLTRKNKILNKLRTMIYKVRVHTQVYDVAISHVNNVRKLDERYECVISSSDPKSSHAYAYKYISSFAKGVPWIQLWSDPFWGDITSGSKWISRRVKKEENKLLSKASLIIYISELLTSNRKKLYPLNKEKMFFLPIPYLSEEKGRGPQQENLTFVYCGDYFSNIRDILPLYEAIRKSNHKLIICGGTNLMLRETENIKIYPRVSYEKVKSIEQKADVLVHLSNKRGVQIPGKIYQYSGTEKNILFILDGESELIEKEYAKYNRFVFTPNNEKDILKIINDRDSWERCDNRILDEFSPGKIAFDMLKLLEQCEVK